MEMDVATFMAKVSPTTNFVFAFVSVRLARERARWAARGRHRAGAGTAPGSGAQAPRAGAGGLRGAAPGSLGCGGDGSGCTGCYRTAEPTQKQLLPTSGLGNLLFSSSNASLFFLDVFTSCEQWEKWTNFLGKWTFHWLKYVPFLFHI